MNPFIEKISQIFEKDDYSPLEKVIYAYDYVTDDDLILEKEKTLEDILINSKVRCYVKNNNIVIYINDDKYTISGIYIIDSFNKDFYTVGEYFSGNTDSLLAYLDYNDQISSLFDAPLHFHFMDVSNNSPAYDMRNIFKDTLIDRRPSKAVTFVDNHDTEPGQSLESWVQEWFKPLAYALIMFRKKGIPCIFYGDYYGVPEKNIQPMKELLDVFLLARKHLAYGEEHDYFDDQNIIGWTREGDYYHQDSGMAVILSNGNGGSKQMNVGQSLANSVLYDCTGNIKETVYVDSDGNGIFYVDGGSVSVWIKKDNMYNL